VISLRYLFEEIQEEKDGLFSKKALAEKGHVSQGDIAALADCLVQTGITASITVIPVWPNFIKNL
jgi:hypothetical protein